MGRLAFLSLTLMITACGGTTPPPVDTVTSAHDGQEVTVMGEARQDGDMAVVVTDGVAVEVERLNWPTEVVGTSVEVRGVLRRIRMQPAIAAAPPMLTASGETTPTEQMSYEGLWRFRLSDAKWYPLREDTDAG